MVQARLYRADMSPNKMDDDAAHARTGATNKEVDDAEKIDDYWLMIARDSYNESESYFDANIRSGLERNLAHFSSRHAPGSKYYSDSYKYRHKGFRPKTRAMVRRNEAAAAVAIFSTSDVVDIRPARSTHPAHRISAEINQSLLQYRLDNTIPWFQTVIAAYQDTMNTGMCISYQYWDYEEQGTYGEEKPSEGEGGRDEQSEAFNEGEESTTSAQSTDTLDEYLEGPEEAPPVILRDTPAIELRPIENVFFSVGCDWRDPAGTSPFIIDKIPMYIDDIKAMSKPGKGTRIPWFELTESQLLLGVSSDYDPVRRQREDNREDSKDQRHLHRGFDISWVHRNIIRKDGRDWVYYTLGIHYRLSDPVPLEDAYPWLQPGERPYIIGFSNIEAHKNYPEGLTGLGAPLQQEANEINNQRRDNVALSLNRRYIVKRSAMIDYAGLQRNVPGGVTETDDPTNDIRIEAPQDITQSAYQEQDRVNADYDELLGVMSGSSVNTNKNLNETVGGMELMREAADILTEYPLKIFVITWMVPVLKQLIKLEQTHESDGALLNLIGEKLKLWHKHGIDRVTDAWIQGSMNIQVNVGFGSTNPEQRVKRLATGLQTIFTFAPQLAQQLDGLEVAKEIFGALGFQGTDRFFPDQKPQSTAPPQQQEGEVGEKEQAEMDQDFQKHREVMEDKQLQRQWEIDKHYQDLEQKEMERMHKKEISKTEYEEKMVRIKTDRQNKVDEMRLKIQEGSGI